MNPFIILLICAMILLASYLWYISHEIPQESANYPNYRKHSKYNQGVLLSETNRVRCPPETVDETPKCQDIQLYDERDIIKNKGFLNDMIYKPKQDMSELKFENQLIENRMPLNHPMCHDELSTDLPLSNVNVNYLLKYNTAKLSV